MWSFTDTRMAETWSEPAIGKVKIGGADKFVMFVGGGYESGNNNSKGKLVFSIDLSNGTNLWDYCNTSSHDRPHLNFTLAANPTAVDPKIDGSGDKVHRVQL